MIDNGLVSIIMPTYNCEKYILEAIKSVQNQSYQNWELMIFDDGSTDETQSIVESLVDNQRIYYYRGLSNKGAAYARNYLLRKARGRWIAFLDSDDMWLPNKLEYQIQFMVVHHYRFSYHNYIEVDENSKELGIKVRGKSCVGRFDLYSCCWMGCLSVMYDADYIKLIQIKNTKYDDLAMWLRVIQNTNCYLLDGVLARYRRRGNSASPKRVWNKIYWHYKLFHEEDDKNVVVSLWWTGMSIMGHIIKKLFYVKKYKVRN